MLLLIAAVAGCGSDDHQLNPTPTVATATPSAAASPATTPTFTASADPTPTRTSTPTPTVTAAPSETPTATTTSTPDRSQLATPVPGTSVVFDLDADLTSPASFYDIPYPSDMRLTAEGRPDLRGFPVPAGNGIVEPLLRIAGDRPGFATLPVAYFRFSAPVAEQNIEQVREASVNAPILLVDVDPDSPERGRLFPVIATTPEPDPYVPEWILTVSSVPGIVLHPDNTYAFVVKRELGDSNAEPLGVSESFAILRSGAAPSGRLGATARDRFAPLWQTLDTIGVDRAGVAAATVFTTGDVVAEMAELATALAARDAVGIEDLRVDPDDGDDHERFCELIGRVRMPQYQKGSPPFDEEGIFETGGDGLPIVQRMEEVPITLTLPRREMPAGGYPLVVYFHGSGGLSSQVVDRGPVTEPGGEPARGEGPAHVLASHGFATLGSAHPLNPERFPGAGDREYLNFSNLAAYRDTFRQGTIEQRLLLDAVIRLRIEPALIDGCQGPSLPEGEGSYGLGAQPVFAIGQSMGAQYLNMAGATDARINAVVPTGSGGMWSLLLFTIEVVPNVPTADLIKAALGTTAPITYLHPALQLLQSSWEAADPIAYAPRLAKRPLAGHPARSIYQPVGRDDPLFPIPIYDAMALAHGNQQAGDVLWTSMQESLSHEGLDQLLAYPVSANRLSEAGTPYTGVVVQYDADPFLPAHHIAFQLDAVKFQYGCFLESLERRGTATVPSSASLGAPCP